MDSASSVTSTDERSNASVEYSRERLTAQQIRHHIWVYKESRYQLADPNFETTVRTLQEVTLPKSTLKLEAPLICHIAIQIPRAASLIQYVAEKDVLDFEFLAARNLKSLLGKDILQKIEGLNMIGRSGPFNIDQLIEIYTLRIAHMYKLIEFRGDMSGFFENVSSMLDTEDKQGRLHHVVILVDAILRCHEYFLRQVPAMNAKTKSTQSEKNQESARNKRRKTKATTSKDHTDDVHETEQSRAEGPADTTAE